MLWAEQLVDHCHKEDPEIKALLEGQDESQIKPTDCSVEEIDDLSDKS